MLFKFEQKLGRLTLYPKVIWDFIGECSILISDKISAAGFTSEQIVGNSHWWWPHVRRVSALRVKGTLTAKAELSESIRIRWLKTQREIPDWAKHTWKIQLRLSCSISVAFCTYILYWPARSLVFTLSCAISPEEAWHTYKISSCFCMKKLSKVTLYCVERGVNGISVSSNNKAIYVCHHSKEWSSHSCINQYAMYWTPSKILVPILKVPWGMLW